MWDKIYIIAGTPGTGKSSVAKELKKKLKLEIFGNKFFGKEIAIGEFGEKIVDIKKVKFKEGIYDSHLACEVKGKRIFILRTEPKELEKRLERRKWPNKKISENIMAELLNYSTIRAKENYEEVYEIDTTNRKPKEVAELIIKKHSEEIDYKEELIKRLQEHAKIREIYAKLYEKYGPQYWWPAKTRFEVIVGAILTQNTSWKNVEKAIRELKKKRLLSAKKIIEVDEKELAETIKSAGYYKQKAKRLKEVSKAYLKFKPSNKEKDRKYWLSIKGVGKETADSILLYAYNQKTFVIDSYTIRMLNNYGIKRWSYDSYKRLFEEALEDYSVKDFKEYHALIVAEGKKTKGFKNLKA